MSLRSQKSSPAVSVMMASFNHAPFLQAAVTSVLQQTWSDLELIVVDDGSSDQSLSILHSIEDPRLIVVDAGPNRRHQVRNLALEKARGNYLAFDSSDELWRPDKLASQVAALEVRSEVNAVFSDVEYVDVADRMLVEEERPRLLDLRPLTSAQWLERFFLWGNALSLNTALVRRSAIEHVGPFRTDMFQFGDYDLWVRLAAIGEFLVLTERLIFSRVEPDVTARGVRRQRRAWHEGAAVLGRFLEPPLLGRLAEIFPGTIPATTSETVQAACLARFAANGRFPSHRLFADRALAAMLAEPAAREELVTYFGPQVVLDFIRARECLELVVDEGS